MTNAIVPRVRSVENMLRRARGATRDLGAPACPVCHVKMWISLFFDGTGNHRQTDFPTHHSNVAALFDAHINDPENAIIPLYYEGLGRKFEFEGRYEEVEVPARGGSYVSKRVGYVESDDRLVGLAFADGITTRLEKAVFDVSDWIERIRGMQRVDEVNLAVFGFSRGATEARAFLHWLGAHSKVTVSGASLRYDGVPLNVRFLGIFDTVESVGFAGKNKLPDLIKTKVPRFVQKCTHIVAAHELRDAFPLTSVDCEHRCIVYPGAHADVGGGYADQQQGRSDKLARIALLQMLDEARAAGLKLRSVGEMKAHTLWKSTFKPSFDVPAEDVAVLQRYMSSVKPVGSVSQHFEAHMNAYWRWIDSGQAITDVQHKRRTYAKQRDREEEFQRMAHMLRCLARTPAGRGATALTQAPNSPLPLPSESSEFFSKLAHDSFEHFSVSGGAWQRDILSSADYYHLRRTIQPIS